MEFSDPDLYFSNWPQKFKVLFWFKEFLFIMYNFSDKFNFKALNMIQEVNP